MTFFSRDCCPLCTILIDLIFLDISTVYENQPKSLMNFRAKNLRVLFLPCENSNKTFEVDFQTNEIQMRLFMLISISLKNS